MRGAGCRMNEYGGVFGEIRSSSRILAVPSTGATLKRGGSAAGACGCRERDLAGSPISRYHGLRGNGILVRSRVRSLAARARIVYSGVLPAA